MQSKIKVIAAILDKRQLILYKEDGSTINIPQGDERIASILEHITEPLAQGKHPVIDFSDYKKPNAYKEYEKNSKGLTRFFRIAKEKLTSIFGSNKEKEAPESGVWGSVPTDNVTKNLNAVEEIMKHADPVDVDVPNTVVVAVHDNKVIPDVQKIEKQFKYANSSKNSVGMTNFLNRISKVIGDRQHSVEDLLSFMEHGDLPIADDGSIVIYKALNRTNDGFVDIHSGNVKQRVGSYVRMDPKMVDHNRRVDCSHGLHVAIRSYLSTFTGSACVIAKVAPEDVIAVPTGYTNKMRVCGYHIIAELSKDSYEKLKANKPFTDGDENQILLANVIAGNHPPADQVVEIRGVKGTNLHITDLNKPVSEIKTEPVKEVKKATAIPTDPKEEFKAPPVDPKQVSKKVVEAKKKPAPSRTEQANKLFSKLRDKKSAEELLAFKRKAKVSWEKLGLPKDTQKSIDTLLK